MNAGGSWSGGRLLVEAEGMQRFVCTCIHAVICLSIFKESYCGGKLRLREREQENKVNVYCYESAIGYHKTINTGQAMTMISWSVNY